MSKTADSIQERIIDTLGVLNGGFFAEPCRIARNLAAQMSDPHGATVIGTRLKTTPDMAAFANATAACYPAMTVHTICSGAMKGIRVRR